MVENWKSPNQKKRILASAITLLFITSILAQTTQINVAWASPTTVYVDPPVTKDSAAYGIGSYFTMAMTVDNIELLWAYQVEMTFNPEVLHGVSVTDSGFLATAGGTLLEAPGPGFDNVAGTLGLYGAFLFEKDPSYLPSTTEAVPLAIITFEVVGIGASPLVFGSNTGLANSTGGWVLGPDFVPIHKGSNPGIFVDGYFDNRYPSALFTYSPESPIAGEPVAFDASASVDLDGTIVSYAWNFGDASTGTGVTSSHAYAQPGSYLVNLTVTDNDGLTDSEIHSVDVLDLTPPVANAGPDQTVKTGVEMTFDGSGSTDNVGIASYEWTFVDGTPKTLTGVNPKYTFMTLGVYTVTLNVSDAAGNWNTDQVVITVIDGTPPVANAGPDQTVNQDAEVTFDGSGSTDNVGVTGYTWTFNDVTPKTLTGVNPKYTFANLGVFVVTLNVTDATGNWATDTVTITVRDATNPVANAGPDQTVNEDTVVTLDGSGSSDNVGVASYTWKFTDGTAKTLTGVKPTYTFSTPGVFTVTLNVTDAAGNWATDTVVITVRDTTNPVANAGPNQTAEAGNTVTFDGSGSTDNVGVVTYLWDFGDGATGTGKTVTHVYSNSGTYTVTLTVKDAAGNTGTDTATVTVTSPPSGLPIEIVAAIIVVVIVVIAVAVFLFRRRK